MAVYEALKEDRRSCSDSLDCSACWFMDATADYINRGHTPHFDFKLRKDGACVHMSARFNILGGVRISVENSSDMIDRHGYVLEQLCWIFK